jgi:hypothetical protein
MIKRTIYITFIFFFLFSCASRKNNINVDAIDRFASSYFPANEPGGAIVIMKHDSIIFSKGYGVADLTTHESITPKTLFQPRLIVQNVCGQCYSYSAGAGKVIGGGQPVEIFP